jgi:hypothetical protein
MQSRSEDDDSDPGIEARPQKSHSEGDDSDSSAEARPQQSHPEDDDSDSNDPSPEERFIAGHAGTQFPKKTPTVYWEAHKISTFLPWIGKQGKGKGKKVLKKRIFQRIVFELQGIRTSTQ